MTKGSERNRGDEDEERVKVKERKPGLGKEKYDKLNTADFPIKLYSFTCFSASVVRQRKKFEIKTETGVIKIIC